MTKPKIVVVGGGAAGLELVTLLGKKLGKKNKASITLVDSSRTHIWKPLLHEVAAGTLNAFHDEQNYFTHAAKHYYDFQLGALSTIDRKLKTIHLSPVRDASGASDLVGERMIEYDILVIAVGSTSNDFSTPGAKENCIFLDNRINAENLHQQFLDEFIKAHSSKCNALSEQNNELPIVIIGGGATGVELAAELHFAAEQYKQLGLDEIPSANIKISIVEASPRLLSVLPEALSKRATEDIASINIQVLTGEKVTQINADEVHTASGKVLKSAIKVWCAGVKAPEILAQLDGLEVNKINQLIVNPRLQTSIDENIFSLGDCAFCKLETGVVPPRAQSAHQQALLLSENILRYIGAKPLKDFQYSDKGSLVSLSQRDTAGILIMPLGKFNVHGLMAKLIYRMLYRNHQLAIHGLYKTGILILSDWLGRSTGQRTKLH